MSNPIYTNYRWQLRDYWYVFLLIFHALLFAILMHLFVRLLLWTVVVILLVFGFYFLIYFHSRLKFFTLYQNSLEIWFGWKKDSKEEFQINDFFQVRFEDKFNAKEGFGAHANMDQIILYPKPGIDSKFIRDQRIELWISDTQRKETLIRILHTFLQKGIDLKLKTRHKIILSQLNLKNWDEV